MGQISFDERLKGCLLGAAIGAELAFSRHAHPERFQLSCPEDVLKVRLEPVTDFQEPANRVTARSLVPFIDLGVQAYLAKGGRVTPEDFATRLEDDAGIAGPVFSWDGVHTVQELLKEGMNPRISGLANAPCGLISASMPAVGIYHFAYPECAYLDGVELASLAQPRVGADWAGLCAAAVAAAFSGGATGESVVDTVLKLAHENSRDVFYQMNRRVRGAAGMAARGDAALAQWWLDSGGVVEGQRETDWVACDPIGPVLTLLSAGVDDVQKMMRLLLTAPVRSWYVSMAGLNAVSAVIGGAVLGALRGRESFPPQWRHWAEAIAQPWYSLAKVVAARMETERAVLKAASELWGQREGGESLLFDKVYGCMLAGAIGNAMGSPVEGRMYWEIDEQYPGGITTVLRPERLEGEDDNQMAMKLVETYLRRDGLPVMARHFGQTWKDSLNRDHFFILCMGRAYDLICEGWDPRITGHWSVVTGSTVMCMEPVGVYHFADPEFAAIDATAVSYMYQRGLDVLAARMLAATVAEALRPDASVDSVCQAAVNAAPDEPLRTFDKRKFKTAREYIERCLEIAGRYTNVLEARKELYEKCLFYHMIDPLELWGFSLAMFKVAQGDVRQAAIGGTNIGRDSDTIAGRAAMLSGTLKGGRSVPADWIALFKPEVLERIKRNARRFAELVGERRVAWLKVRRQVVGDE